MEVTVKLNNIRISPHKIRPVLPIVKGKTTSNALDILKFTNKACAKELYQLVKSGIAAANDHEMNTDQLFIKIIKCDQAQMFKRHLFKARGRVTRIQKRSSHLTLIISDAYAAPVITDTKEKIDFKEVKSKSKSLIKSVKKDNK